MACKSMRCYSLCLYRRFQLSRCHPAPREAFSVCSSALASFRPVHVPSVLWRPSALLRGRAIRTKDTVRRGRLESFLTQIFYVLVSLSSALLKRANGEICTFWDARPSSEPRNAPESSVYERHGGLLRGLLSLLPANRVAGGATSSRKLALLCPKMLSAFPLLPTSNRTLRLCPSADEKSPKVAVSSGSGAASPSRRRSISA
jgi:hypothetical protein